MSSIDLIAKHANNLRKMARKPVAVDASKAQREKDAQLIEEEKAFLLQAVVIWANDTGELSAELVTEMLIDVLRHT